MQVEALYRQLGLNTPLTRFAATGAATYGVLWLVKPKLMFQKDKSGKEVVRPWSFLANPNLNPNITPTPFSIGVASVVGGAIAALFV